MAVRFLLGRARSGKSRAAIAEAAAECARDPLGAPLIFLVPEQMSYETERALLSSGKLRGYTRAQVLSFTRLSDFIFARRPAPRLPRLQQTHRRLLASWVVERRRMRSPQGHGLPRGFEDAFDAFISEARQQRLDLSAVRRLLENAQAPSAIIKHLAEKLGLAEELFAEYGELLRDRFEDPSDSLAALASEIPRCDFLQGARIAVDGFIGFTPVEERLLAALGRRAEELQVLLTLDPHRAEAMMAGRDLPPHPVFGPAEETLARLRRLFAENDVATHEPRFFRKEETPQRTSVAAALYGRPFDSPPPVTSFHACASPAAEARMAAEIAAQWVADGMDPGEIAILVRDLEPSRGPLAEALRNLRIPHFIDQAQPLDTHPLVVGVQSLLAAFADPRETRHLIALGKSGLLPVDRSEVDRLEMHVARFPRSPAQWYAKDAWKAPPPRSAGEDEAANEAAFPVRIDATRRALVEWFRRFADAVPPDGEGTFGDFLRALCAWLGNVVESHPLAEGDAPILAQAGELLGQANDALGAERVPWAQAADFASSLLASVSMPRIPPMLGQLFVGALDRSRAPRIRGLVLAGFADGVFPRAARNTTLLNDSERDLLESMGVDVKPASRRMFQREFLLAYRALQLPAERLAILRPAAQADGAAMAPSIFWTLARDFFPDFAEPPVAGSPDDSPARCWRVRELASAAIRCIDTAHRRPVAPLRALPHLERASAAAPQEAARVISSAQWRNRAALSPGILAEILGGNLSSSASSLEQFADCAFKHFVGFFLRPERPAKPRFEATDAGHFAHAALANFTLLCRERGIDFGQASEASLDAVAREAIAEPRRAAVRSGLLDSALGAITLDRLEREVLGMMRWLAGTFRDLPLHPVAEEAAFRANGDFPPLEIPLGNGAKLLLRGQIDRLDEVTGDGGAGCFLVVDYKLREKKFDFAEWEDGANLQLPIYLLAVAAQGRTPAGALFAPILAKRESDGTSRERQYLGVLRRTAAAAMLPSGAAWKDLPHIQSLADPDGPGLPPRWGAPVSEAEFEALLARSAGMLRRLGEDVIGGNADVRPVRRGTDSACSFCDFRPVCQIDVRLNPFRERIRRGRQEVLMSLREPAE